jgi:NADH dehydrogenase FAD-containing subunit
VVQQLNTQVTDYVDDTVFFTTGKTIQTKNLIWAAGVSAMVFEAYQPKVTAAEEWLPMISIK